MSPPHTRTQILLSPSPLKKKFLPLFLPDFPSSRPWFLCMHYFFLHTSDPSPPRSLVVIKNFLCNDPSLTPALMHQTRAHQLPPLAHQLHTTPLLTSLVPNSPKKFLTSVLSSSSLLFPGLPRHPTPVSRHALRPPPLHALPNSAAPSPTKNKLYKKKSWLIRHTYKHKLKLINININKLKSKHNINSNNTYIKHVTQ